MARRKRARSTSPSDTARNVRTKEAAFAERYDTANKTNEQVLSEFFFSFFSFFIWNKTQLFSHCFCVVLLTWKSIELQLKNWSSACYKHFKPPVIIEEKGEVKYQFTCKTYVTSLSPLI
jgi:hypothetical protein